MHRPSIKGTKLLFIVIKAIIIIKQGTYTEFETPWAVTVPDRGITCEYMTSLAQEDLDSVVLRISNENAPGFPDSYA